MGADTLRNLPALALLALATGLAGCGGELEALARAEGVDGAAVVPLSETQAVAARLRGATVEVIAFSFDGEGWSSQVIGSSQAAAQGSVSLFGYAGDTDEKYNTFAYGSAGEDVSRVQLTGLAAAGGRVIDGAWVLALREKELAPNDLHWRFLSAEGGVLAEGTGIRP